MFTRMCLLAIFSVQVQDRDPVWLDIVSKLNMMPVDKKAKGHVNFRQLDAAIPFLLSLTQVPDPTDSSSWGNISLDGTVDFCTTRRANPCISVFRLNLLEVTGCKHTRTQIQELVTEAIGLQIRYRQLKDRTGFDHGRIQFNDYRALLHRLGYRSYDQIQSATATHIQQALLGVTGMRSSYLLVKEERQRFKCDAVIQELEMTLPHTYTGLSVVDRILLQAVYFNSTNCS
jgi:hypothetical protein